MEDMRVLHRRTALMLSLIPSLVTGPVAVWIALRYRKEPGSLVRPMLWAFPVTLVLGGLQTAGLLLLVLSAFLDL